ncbi:MAG: glycosyltransferase family 4 protein [Gammaproteobacteria bacterium]
MEKKKLKILFVTSDRYPPFRPAAKVVFGEEMAKRGHVIDWLLQAEKNCTENYSTPYGNGTAYIGKTDDGHSRFARLKKHIYGFLHDLQLLKLTKKNHYDIIQVKDQYLAAVLAIIVSRIRKIKCCYWLAYPHAEASLYAARQGIARYRFYYFLRGSVFKLLLYKIILPLSDHVFVQSEQMKKDIAAYNIDEDKMTPIPGSISLADIPFEAAQGFPEKPCSGNMIVYLGTLIRARRLDFVIRMMSVVLKEAPDAKLYLLGKGEMPEDEQLLRDEARSLGIGEHIVFTGFLPMREAWNYIRRADVCISPYYPTPILNSTSPTKLIEYMAMGKAVVGNNHPEQDIVVNESGAGYCVPWNEKEFAGAVLKIIKNPELAKQMGKKGREYVVNNRVNSTMTDLIEKQYYRILSLSEE